MPSTSLDNVFSMEEECKPVFFSKTNSKETFARISILNQENVLSVKPKWFKGSRDRGLRGNLAA